MGKKAKLSNRPPVVAGARLNDIRKTLKTTPLVFIKSSSQLPDVLLDQLDTLVVKSVVDAKPNYASLSQKDQNEIKSRVTSDPRFYSMIGVMKSSNVAILITSALFDKLQAAVEACKKSVDVSLVGVGRGQMKVLIEDCKPCSEDYDHLLRVLRFGEPIENPYKD